MRRSIPGPILAVAGLLSVAGSAAAHHGWTWTSSDDIELVGVIVSASLGNPHGVLQVDADGDTWTVEVGQPWRNEQAGLTDDDFAEGVEATFVGQPSADPEERRLKVERLTIDGVEHVLYPDRD